MKEESLIIRPTLNLQLVPGSPDKIILIDNLEISPEQEVTVLHPYLESIWHGMNGCKSEGIRPSSFVEVTHSLHNFIVHGAPCVNIRKTVHAHGQGQK